MNYKIFFILFFLILNSCVNTQIQKKDKISASNVFFINKGFALIYSEDLKKDKIVSKQLNDRSLVIFQKNLKKDTTVKITNLINQKYIIAKVGKNASYPNFFNSVISKRISKELVVDKDEPYIEIKEIYSKSLFIAKKSKIFDEEKNVAIKVPVDDVKIKDLSNSSYIKKKKIKKKFYYIIKVADFYFEKSANSMLLRIKNETLIKNVNIDKISSTKFRVFLGPFDNLNSLKKQFNAINTLQFENIEIIKK